MGETEIHQIALGIFPVDNKGGQVIEQKSHVQVKAEESDVHHILPDGLSMRGDGFQSTPQAIIIELLRRDAQGVDQHRLSQPVGYLVQRPRSGESVED